MSRVDRLGGPIEPHSEGDPYSGEDLIGRLLDRGIVIDATCRVDVAGVHLVTVDMWVIVASLETFGELAAGEAGEALGIEPPPWMPAIRTGTPRDV